MKEEWFAIVEKNLTCIVFSTPAFSGDILYWVKRYNNGKYHTAVTTGNRYELRSFEIYDKNLKLCTIAYGVKNIWQCLEIEETCLDAHGSRCNILIADPKDKIQKILMHGYFHKGYGGFQVSINENFYFTSLMLFLILLSEYADWENLEKQDFNLFNDIKSHNGVPQWIFEETEKINSKM